MTRKKKRNERKRKNERAKIREREKETKVDLEKPRKSVEDCNEVCETKKGMRTKEIK